MKKKMIALLLALASIPAVSVSCLAQSSLGGGRLAGMWNSNVHVFNCGTRATIARFQSTAVFGANGTFSGITSGLPPAIRTNEVGIWRHSSANQYKFRFKAYQFPPNAPVFYQLVTHTLELGADNASYTSSGGVIFYALDGTQTGEGWSEGVGTRVTLD